MKKKFTIIYDKSHVIKRGKKMGQLDPKYFVNGEPAKIGVLCTVTLRSGVEFREKEIMQPGDTFDFEVGKKITDARMEKRLAEYRLKDAARVYEGFSRELEYFNAKANQAYKRMLRRGKELAKIEGNLADVLASLQDEEETFAESIGVSDEPSLQGEAEETVENETVEAVNEVKE